MEPRGLLKFCDPIRLGPLLWTRLNVGLLETFRVVVVTTGRLIFPILFLTTIFGSSTRRRCGVLFDFGTSLALNTRMCEIFGTCGVPGLSVLECVGLNGRWCPGLNDVICPGLKFVLCPGLNRVLCPGLSSRLWPGLSSLL